jgi:hypothetical protein
MKTKSNRLWLWIQNVTQIRHFTLDYPATCIMHACSWHCEYNKGKPMCCVFVKMWTRCISKRTEDCFQAWHQLGRFCFRTNTSYLTYELHNPKVYTQQHLLIYDDQHYRAINNSINNYNVRFYFIFLKLFIENNLDVHQTF